MKRLIRTVLWLGAVAAVLWLARLALKSFIDGPEVTPASGGWPDRAGAGAGARSAPAARAGAPAAPASTSAGDARDSQAPAKPRKAAGTSKPAPPQAASPKAADKARKTEAGTKKASRPSRRPAPAASSSGSAVWVVPNGTAEVLQTHPVKVKLSSRVYRVPGMPMYDRTVADRCYPTVEAAEADGFTRAAR